MTLTATEAKLVAAPLGHGRTCPGHPDNQANCACPHLTLPPQSGGAGTSPAMTPRVLLLFNPYPSLVPCQKRATTPIRTIDVSRETLYFPIQKSRKITSRTFSTSTRPINRPNARDAKRSSSAIMSSRPDASSAQACRSASAQSANALRCLCRVTSADSPPSEKNCLAYSASPPTRSSNDAPVSAEIR